MPPPKPLFYTFGNHMHWVDMQWLWGYDVLPGCVADMLHLCRETGAKGCVNFDGIGYEKMAAESPEALAALRSAVKDGEIEPVGCSYGQPYGLFHGGESNIRQFTYGSRAVLRLLGVRPRTFWEEEFYFLPQLPQILRSCGFTGANLFFQWTWHTPEVPRESSSLILWEGEDGSRIPALPRNSLNVHQWPEDFDGLLEQGLVNELDFPAIVQWLELMPSRDWMCRSEVLLPRLKELFADPRFDVRARTCEKMIRELAACYSDGGTEASGIPVRRYSPDDVWHGLTLAKNADRHPRMSRQAELAAIAAESLSSLAGLFGRPYASWDVYPTWELDEAWRELLSAQHHDNHECEGLCGAVGYHSFERSLALTHEVHERTRAHLEQRAGASVVGNPLGWSRTIETGCAPEDGVRERANVTIPPFGYASSPLAAAAHSGLAIRTDDSRWTLTRAGLRVEVDPRAGTITQIRTGSHPNGVLASGRPLLDVRSLVGGEARGLPKISRVDRRDSGVVLVFESDAPGTGEGPRPVGGDGLRIEVSLPANSPALDIRVEGIEHLARPDAGFAGALRMPIEPMGPVHEIRTDSAYAIHACAGSARVRRKYPEGDWMTSPQWFEQVEGSIVAHSMIDMLDAEGNGLLVAHTGSQQWFRTERGLEVILNAYCPWDEARYDPHPGNTLAFRLIPHGGLRDVDRARLAAEFNVEALRPTTMERAVDAVPVGGGDRSRSSPIPAAFGGAEVSGAPGVLAHAFFRESAKAGEHLPDWAGHRLAHESEGVCTHPYMLRLVEWNGEPGSVTLRLPGPVPLAAKTNLMGECGPWQAGEAPTDAPPHLRDTGWLRPSRTTAPDWDAEGAFEWCEVSFGVRAREIATVMADLVPGRKQFRDLDDKRKVWATVHRTDGEPDAPRGAIG